MRLATVCPSERKVIGWLNAEPGTLINRAVIARSWESVDPQRCSSEEMTTRQTDGACAVCPRCGTLLVWAVEGQTMASAIADRFQPILGGFHVPRAGERQRAQRSAPRKPDEREPLIVDEKDR